MRCVTGGLGSAQPRCLLVVVLAATSGRPTAIALLVSGFGRAAEAQSAYEDGIAAATRMKDQHARDELGQALEAVRARGAGR